MIIYIFITYDKYCGIINECIYTSFYNIITNSIEDICDNIMNITSFNSTNSRILTDENLQIKSLDHNKYNKQYNTYCGVLSYERNNAQNKIKNNHYSSKNNYVSIIFNGDISLNKSFKSKTNVENNNIGTSIADYIEDNLNEILISYQETYNKTFIMTESNYIYFLRTIIMNLTNYILGNYNLFVLCQLCPNNLFIVHKEKQLHLYTNEKAIIYLTIILV